LITKENPLNRDFKDPKEAKQEESQKASASSSDSEAELGQASKETLEPSLTTDTKA